MAQNFSDLSIGGAPVDELIRSDTEKLKPTKMSQLTNDANFAKTTDKVANATTADTATTLSVNSGVQAGSKGPTGALTLAVNNKTGTIKIPQFTVTAQGVITSIVERTLSITTGCLHCSVSSGCSNCKHCNQTSTCSNCKHCNDCDRCYYCNQYP